MMHYVNQKDFPQNDKNYGVCVDSATNSRRPIPYISGIIDHVSADYLYSNPLFTTYDTENYILQKFDLNTYTIEHPLATFIIKAIEHSTTDTYKGLLVVAPSLKSIASKKIIMAIKGELTVKQLCRTPNEVKLIKKSVLFTPASTINQRNLPIWGVITHIIYQYH